MTCARCTHLSGRGYRHVPPKPGAICAFFMAVRSKRATQSNCSQWKKSTAHLSVAQAWMPPNFWLLPASIVNYEPEVFANACERPGFCETVPNGAFDNRNCLTCAALTQSAIEMPPRTV